jgi:hypothetical protein
MIFIIARRSSGLLAKDFLNKIEDKYLYTERLEVVKERLQGGDTVIMSSYYTHPGDMKEIKKIAGIVKILVLYNGTRRFELEKGFDRVLSDCPCCENYYLKKEVII